jgi:hypothetical protein
MEYSKFDSADSRVLQPPRNWLGMNDIYLVR